MVYFAALVIFLVIAAATWIAAVALYQFLLGEPDLRRDPNFTPAGAMAVLLVTLLSFIPFPWGYFLSLAVWWFMAKGILGLPWGRATALFVILAALSFLSRLAVLGVLSF